MTKTNIKTQDFDFKVTRQVLQLTPEMIPNYEIEFFMEEFGLRCRPKTSGYGSWGTEDPEYTGVYFRDSYDEDAETVHAKFGDYIVINGYRDAYVLTAEEFTKSGATPSA
jgi:hypothetical protein